MKLSVEANAVLEKIKDFSLRSKRTKFPEVDVFGASELPSSVIEELVSAGLIDYVDNGYIHGPQITIKNIK